MLSSNKYSASSLLSDNKFSGSYKPSSKSINLKLEAKPSRDWYKRRREVLAALKLDNDARPWASFCQQIDSLLTWSSANVSYKNFTFSFSYKEISEIKAALKDFKGLLTYQDKSV